MAWNYSEKTKQLFLDAVQGKPGTHLGEVAEPDGVGEHGSIACGDALRFTFRCERHPTDPTKDVITEARYLTFGCTSAIAASEALCAIIEGSKFTPIEALKIKNEDIVRFLDGLPEQKIHCSVMGAEALTAAVFDWAKQRGVDLRALGVDILPEEKEHGRLVCKCFGLTEPYLKRKIKELGVRTIAGLTAATKAGGACGSCHHEPGGLQDLLNEVWGTRASIPPAPARAVAVAPSGLVQDVDVSRVAPRRNADVISPFQLMKKIEKTFDGYVRPMLQKDGGDVELVDIKDRTVYVRMAGACASCVGANATIKLLVERALKERVDEQIRVIAV